jgi:hypothetical protein
MAESEHLDLALISGLQREEPLTLSWPMEGIPAGWLSIQTPDAWREFVLSLNLPDGIPEIVRAKYRRAQMLYFLAWLYPDLIKAGELVGLTTLELTFFCPAAIYAERRTHGRQNSDGAMLWRHGNRVRDWTV